MIQEDYVSFETAKLLKEKGFDESTNCQYPVGGIHIGEVSEYNITDRSRNPENYIPAPTLQMAMKWLREVHNITIGITFSLDIITYEIQKDEKFITAIGSSRPYEDMVEEAIKYCLENLI